MSKLITSRTNTSYTVWDTASKHYMEFGIVDGQIRVIRQSRLIADKDIKWYKLLGKWLQLKAWATNKWHTVVHTVYRLHKH
jgi:hypothetical protein